MKAFKAKAKQKQSNQGESGAETVSAAVDLKQSPQDRAADLIKTGNIDILKKLLSDQPVEDSFVNVRHTKSGKYLATIATEEGSLDALKLLIEFNAKVNEIDKSGSPPLLHAVRYGYKNIIEYLLQNGSDINGFEETKHENALMTACRYFQTVCATFLIQKGIDLNYRNLNEENAFHVALKFQCYEVATLLLSKGSDINSTSTNGNSVLIRSVFDNKEESVQFLLKVAGVDIDLMNINGETALFVASRHGLDRIVATLVQSGAKVNLTDKFGRTALFAALAGKKFGVVEVLLDASTRPHVNTCDHFACSPLSILCRQEESDSERLSGLGKARWVQKLLSMGADVNSRDRCFRTALMYACGTGSEDVVALLLMCGADPDLVDINQKRAIDFIPSLSDSLKENYLGLVAKYESVRAGVSQQKLPQWVERLHTGAYLT